jgi:asparaginyl-tRNA synthetase
MDGARLIMVSEERENSGGSAAALFWRVRREGFAGRSAAQKARKEMAEETAPTEETRNDATPVAKKPAHAATIAGIGQHAGESVTLHGWLYNSRESGKLLFPIFRDGTGSIQGVAHVKSVSPEVFEKLKGLTQESSVIVTGKVRADQRAPGGYELDVEDIEVVQRVPESDPYPITLKEHGVEFLQERRHLWVRSPRQSAILRIRAEIMRAAAEYFDSNGFIRTDPPILTPAACEGTSTLFPVDYFGDPAYLTQSGQLYIESTALALGKVYSFGPTFRAEKSKTRRHLTEFWMIEPEVSFLDLDGLMSLAEEFIAYIVQSVLKNRAPELQVIGRDATKLEAIKVPFPKLRYDEAAEMLNQAHKDGKLEAPFEYGNDFGSPDETWLSSQFDRPVMVHRYPADVKAFYMEPDPKDPRYALCVDVLAPEGYGEIIGGSQRVSSYELLSSRIDQHKLPRAAFEWYLDLRRYGSVPHAGFGMGIERLVAWVCALDHVRETIPFPRMLNRMYP